MASCSARADLIASITREISPLEATVRNGLSGSPGFGEKSSSSESVPLRRGSSLGESRASNSDCRKPEIDQIAGAHFLPVSAPRSAALSARLPPRDPALSLRFLDLFRQSLQLRVAPFDFAHSLRRAFAEGNNLGNRAAVFAFQCLEKRDALFELRELFRIEIEFLRITIERARDFRQFDHGGCVRLRNCPPGPDRSFPARAGAAEFRRAD